MQLANCGDFQVFDNNASPANVAANPATLFAPANVATSPGKVASSVNATIRPTNAAPRH